MTEIEVTGKPIRVPGYGTMRYKALIGPQEEYWGGTNECIMIVGAREAAPIKMCDIEQQKCVDIYQLHICPTPTPMTFRKREEQPRGIMGMSSLGAWPPGVDHRWEGYLDRGQLCGDKTLEFGRPEGFTIKGVLPAFGLSCKQKEIAAWIKRHKLKNYEDIE